MSQLASARPLTAEEKAQAYGDDLIAQIAQVRVRVRVRVKVRVRVRVRVG